MQGSELRKLLSIVKCSDPKEIITDSKKRVTNGKLSSIQSTSNEYYGERFLLDDKLRKISSLNALNPVSLSVKGKGNQMVNESEQ